MKTDNTANILQAMLTENTGRHMLDSGGAYGRAWERNQGRNFLDENYVTCDFHVGYDGLLEVDHTRSVFHFLLENLRFEPKLDRRFKAWIKRVDPDDDRGWIDLMESFPEYLESKGHEIAGMYGGGSPFTENTYNGECNLSQTLQFHYFEIDGAAHVLLQIHGGCDVRGGYTAPRAFSLRNDESFLMVADGYVSCDHCGENWSTDDNYHWYLNGSTAHSDLRLGKLAAIGADNDAIGWLCEWKFQRGEKIDFDYLARTYGTPDRFVPVFGKNRAICPICGEGELVGH